MGLVHGGTLGQGGGAGTWRDTRVRGVASKWRGLAWTCIRAWGWGWYVEGH